MIKLIATDMDGTLLNSKHEIDDSFYEVLPKLQEKGIKFTIASGRQYYSLLDTFEGISDNLLFIAENGTYVMYRGEEIMVNPLDKDLAHKLRGKKCSLTADTDDKNVYCIHFFLPPLII